MAKNNKEQGTPEEKRIPAESTEDNIQKDNVKNEQASAESAAKESDAQQSAKDEKSQDDPRDEKIKSLEKSLKDERDKYLRLAAEYDNFRKRSMKEQEGLLSDVRCDTIKRILPVYDNLSRALAQETADTAFKKGVEMTMTQLEQILEKLNVKPIPAVGEKFDPSLHNAVMHVEDDTYDDGVIIQEYEKGFKLGDKVIRFSLVVVAN